MNGGPRGNPPLKVFLHGAHARLLKHNLGHPNGVPTLVPVSTRKDIYIFFKKKKKKEQKELPTRPGREAWVARRARAVSGARADTTTAAHQPCWRAQLVTTGAVHSQMLGKGGGGGGGKKKKKK